MVRPFLYKLQLLIFPMLMLDIQRDDDLDLMAKLLYPSATGDILPTSLLQPMHHYFFGNQTSVGTLGYLPDYY